MVKQEPDPLRELFTPVELMCRGFNYDGGAAIRGQERWGERALQWIGWVVQHSLRKEASVKVDHD